MRSASRYRRPWPLAALTLVVLVACGLGGCNTVTVAPTLVLDGRETASIAFAQSAKGTMMLSNDGEMPVDVHMSFVNHETTVDMQLAPATSYSVMIDDLAQIHIDNPHEKTAVIHYIAKASGGMSVTVRPNTDRSTIANASPR